MNFSKHALEKITLFGITEGEVHLALTNPELTCEDIERNSKVFILKIRNRMFSIYRTDERKLYSRIRSGR